jgi:type II secretory pathway component PulL
VGTSLKIVLKKINISRAHHLLTREAVEWWADQNIFPQEYKLSTLPTLHTTYSALKTQINKNNFTFLSQLIFVNLCEFCAANGNIEN